MHCLGICLCNSARLNVQGNAKKVEHFILILYTVYIMHTHADG